MVKWFEKVNQYYSEFSGVFTHINRLNWRVVGSAFFGFLFIAHMVSIFFRFDNYPNSMKLVGLFVSEVVFVIFYAILFQYKNKQTIASYNHRNKTNFESIEQVKIHKLKCILNCQQNSFFSEAKRLDEMISLLTKHPRAFSISISSISDWVYHKDARPRIITLLIFLASAIVVLSVRDGSSLNTVFYFYRDLSLLDLMGRYAVLVAFCAMTLLALTIAFKFCVQLLLRVEGAINSRELLSLPAVQYVIRDLLSFHSNESEVTIHTKKNRFFHRKFGR